MSYNGWVNRDTWAVMLHMDNDQGLYDYYRDTARTVLEEHEDSEPEERVEAVAQAMESIMRPYLDPRVYLEEFDSTITLAAWLDGPGLIAEDVIDPSDIDWSEIAEHVIRDLEG